MNICYLIQFVWVRNLGLAYLGGLWLGGSLMRLQSRCQWGLVIWRFEIGGSISGLAHSHDYCHEDLAPHHVDISIALLEHPDNMEADFSQSKWSKKQQEGSCSAFKDLVSEFTHCLSHHLLFLRRESLSLAHIQGEQDLAPPKKGGFDKEMGNSRCRRDEQDPDLIL